jgi:DNA-binding CsgD family transcriptional regulator/tetratricopeptide (TPR) repeat protein
MAGEHAVGTVGRIAGRALLGEAAAGIAAGRGRALLIEGEPGVGKSALLESGLAAVDGRVCTVLRSRCDELSRRLPLSVMMRALGLDERSEDQRRAWAEATSTPDPVTAAVERLLAVVHRLCEAGPVVLAVEDLHWADEASLLLWRQLSRASARLPLLLVATCRTAPPRTELERLRHDMRAHGGVLVSLSRLFDIDVSTMAARLAGGAPGPRLLERLRLAAGNPLYVRELVDAAARAGDLIVTGGVAELTEEGAGAAVGSRSLVDVIADRLDGLSADTRQVLRTAAVLGPDLSVMDLASVLGRSPDGVAAAVGEALAAGLLNLSTGRTLRFRHGLLVEYLHQTTPAALRAALCRHAAQRLTVSGAPVERVGRLILSAPEAADDWVVEWVVENAGPLAAHAQELAAQLLELALRHLALDDPRYDGLEDRLVAVCYQLGRYTRCEQLTRGILARVCDKQRIGRTVWHRGFSLLKLGRAEAAALLVADHAQAEFDPLWGARLSTLRSTLLHHQRRSAEAAREAAAALAEGEGLGDPTASCHGLHVLSVLSRDEGEVAVSLDRIDRALVWTRERPELASIRPLLLCDRSDGLNDLGRFAEADADLREARRLAERGGAAGRLAVVRTKAAERAFEYGRWDDALAELADDGEQLDRNFAVVRHGLAALIALYRDDHAEALRRFALLERHPLPEGPPWAVGYLVMARALESVRTGRRRQALAELAVVCGPDFRPHTTFRVDSFPKLVRLALEAGEQDTARAAVAACESGSGRAPLARERAAVQWCRALLSGDPAGALDAASAYREVKRLPALGGVLEDVAALQAAAGDLDAARDALTEALAVYAGLGDVVGTRRASARLRPYGVRPGVRGPRQRPKSGWEALTATELRVAEQVVLGRSNPEIATQLMLSRRTVETHVSHILGKLRINSRHEVGRSVPEVL